MFNTEFPIYGMMILLTLLVNIAVVVPVSKKYNFKKDEIICLLLYENFGIIYGAKILTFLHNFNALEGQFDFIALGMSSYGGLIGALLFLILFSLQFKKPLKDMLYIFMPSIPIMYSIGKIGCFFSGCCYGIEYNGFGSVTYNYSLAAPANIPLLPVQILETIFFMVIFIFMIFKHKKNQFDLRTIGISFILCSLSKFALDFLRHNTSSGFLSLNQILSIAFAIIGIGIIVIDTSSEPILARKA